MKVRFSISIIVVSFAVFLCSTPTLAAPLMFSATISSAQEVPTNATAATGFATFLLNDAMTALSFSATIFGLDFTGTQTADPNDNLIAAHIHASATAFPGTNAPVVWGFFGAPFNDNNPNDMTLTAFATGVGGMVTGKWDLPEGNSTAANPNVTLATQLPFILQGSSYINFHTTQFPGGAIRGQIALVPEPATLTLVGIGIGGLVLSRRRRRIQTH
jgi:CHRD domain-containing protein/PEP-CTERM motif-containing protein